MARLTKDAWRKSSLKTSEVEVDELGGSVLIRELPAQLSADLSGLIEVVNVGREQKAKVDTAKMERKQFAFGVIDDSGEPLFTEDEVGELAQKHGRAFKTVIAAIDKLSGVDKEEVEKTEARFPAGGKSESGTDVDAGASARSR